MCSIYIWHFWQGTWCNWNFYFFRYFIWDSVGIFLSFFDVLKSIDFVIRATVVKKKSLFFRPYEKCAIHCQAHVNQRTTKRTQYFHISSTLIPNYSSRQGWRTVFLSWLWNSWLVEQQLDVGSWHKKWIKCKSCEAYFPEIKEERCAYGTAFF